MIHSKVLNCSLSLNRIMKTACIKYFASMEDVKIISQDGYRLENKDIDIQINSFSIYKVELIYNYK